MERNFELPEEKLLFMAHVRYHVVQDMDAWNLLADIAEILAKEYYESWKRQ